MVSHTPYAFQQGSVQLGESEAEYGRNVQKRVTAKPRIKLNAVGSRDAEPILTWELIFLSPRHRW